MNRQGGSNNKPLPNKGQNVNRSQNLNASYMEFEFVSDDEDNCVLIDPVVFTQPSVNDFYEDRLSSSSVRSRGQSSGFEHQQQFQQSIQPAKSVGNLDSSSNYYNQGSQYSQKRDEEEESTGNVSQFLYSGDNNDPPEHNQSTNISQFFSDTATQISQILESRLATSTWNPPKPELNDSSVQTEEEEVEKVLLQEEKGQGTDAVHTAEMSMMTIRHETNDSAVQTEEMMNFPPPPTEKNEAPAKRVVLEDTPTTTVSFNLKAELPPSPQKLETSKEATEKVEIEPPGEKAETEVKPSPPAVKHSSPPPPPAPTVIQDMADLKISFMNFAVGDIALFVPIDEKRNVWMAFHSNRPYRFLADESLKHFLEKDKKHHAAINKNSLSHNNPQKERSRILGRIFFIDRVITSEEENPYNLPPGTCYYICYVEPLLVPKKRI